MELRARKRISGELLLLLPILLFMIVFYIYPLLNLFKISLYDNGELTLAHFAKLFSTDLYLRVFWRSVRLALFVTLVSFLLGYPLAYYIQYSKRKLELFGIVALSMWLSVIIRSYGWVGVLGTNGVLNYILSLADLPGLKLLHSETAVIIGMVHILLPYMVLPIYSVMNGMNHNVIKASKSLGASNGYTFAKVYFPISLPGVIAGCLLVFIQAIGFYITPALLGSPRNIMIAQLIDLQVNELLNWPFASVLSVFLLTITVVSLYICSKVVPMKLLWGGK